MEVIEKRAFGKIECLLWGGVNAELDGQMECLVGRLQIALQVEFGDALG